MMKKIEHGHRFGSNGRCRSCGMKSSYWADVLHAYAKRNFDYERLMDSSVRKLHLKKWLRADSTS